MNKMNKYTAIVLYPDWALRSILGVSARTSCPMAYVAHVAARDLLTARREAQLQAMRQQENANRGRRADWKVVAILAGHAKVEWVS